MDWRIDVGQRAEWSPAMGQRGPVATPSVTVAESAPSVLDPARVRELREQLVREYLPVGPTESAIVTDMARHAAAMERWGAAAEAIQREAARCVPALAAAISGSDTSEDLVLSAAMSTEAADRSERQHLGHSRAFYRARAVLEELQQRRQQRAARTATLPPPGFPDEAACRTYLIARLQRGACRCTRCGSRDGYIVAHRCWECRGCGQQRGLRAGTVMSRSPLPLWPWFEAVRWLLWSPTINTRELATKIEIPRLATVRTIARRIHAAMASDNASELLAGLDSHYGRLPSPDPGVLGTHGGGASQAAALVRGENTSHAPAQTTKEPES